MVTIRGRIELMFGIGAMVRAKAKFRINARTIIKVRHKVSVKA